MSRQATELRYAIRFRVVSKYFGQLCMVLAALTLVPLVASFIFAEWSVSLRYGVVVGGLAAVGLGLSRLTAPTKVQPNEGMILVALMFLFTPLVMSYPMMSAGLSFLDALFEAISGVTTTGLSTTTDIAEAPQTFRFARAWMQWYGGLGIVVLSLAIVMQPGLVAKGLASSKADPEDLVGGTRAYARRALIVYGVLTLVGIAGTWLAGIRSFDAVLYAFAAVSTGGFAPNAGSLAAFGWPAQVWVTLLCLSGAVPLAFYFRMLKRKRQIPLELLQLRAIIIASLVVSLAVAATMRLSAGTAWSHALHHGPLLALAAQTTAGFSSLTVGQLDVGSKLILVFSMLTGGGVGSTAGGFKLLRLLIAFSVVRSIVVRTCLPKHAVLEPRLARQRLQDPEIQAALILIALFLAVVGLSWLPFVAMGYDPIDSLFEVASATGTVGLSAGITDSALPPLLKIILCMDMLLGRLEVMAWLVMFFPGTWFGRRLDTT